ncbi:uncharacterized protein LOC135823847 [Sycon ciliatum]|uniref:uncharacterized protein LOC135823847 n=1 Tax=Sycon ciliatum TaxID=27933 RepID=UPI0031F6D26A
MLLGVKISEDVAKPGLASRVPSGYAGVLPLCSSFHFPDHEYKRAVPMLRSFPFGSRREGSKALLSTRRCCHSVSDSAPAAACRPDCSATDSVVPLKYHGPPLFPVEKRSLQVYLTGCMCLTRLQAPTEAECFKRAIITRS